LQLIAAAGGLKEYADARNISIVRVENERQATFVFNYQEFVARKNQDQNIRLRPGDTVIVR
jgi:protein involved in polysaccharide export with SLBB domain